jgi:hypothetical protein
MRARTAIALALASFAALARVVSGCTLYVAAQLPPVDGSAPVTLGDCFNLTPNQCGQCIANSCENPSGSPPVSLKQVCSLDKYASIISEANGCASDPRLADYNCTAMYVDGGTYASSIADENAAVSNLQHCITDNCRTACSECGAQVPTCGSETINLPEAGTCGVCLDQAMNPPNSACQPWVLAGGCYESSSAIGQCAIPAGQCSTADCSGLSNPSTSLVSETLGLYKCLWQQCGSSCQ